MNQITFITPGFAVTRAPSPEDFAEAAEKGFRAVINNRPDSEEEAQLTGAEEGDLAGGAGLQYRHIPARMADLFSNDVVGAMREALDTLDGPILAHCKTGARSAILWAAAEARAMPVDKVLEILREAGFDLDVLRDKLDAQALRTSTGRDPIAKRPPGGEAA